MSMFPLPALRTSLINSFPYELILSFLFSNTLFPYKTPRILFTFFIVPHDDVEIKPFDHLVDSQ